MSKCPLMATLLKSVSHLMLDSTTKTILLPQFSSSSVKSLLALLYSGQCPITQDCGLEEIKQVMEAVGFNVGTGDLVKMKVEAALSGLDVETSHDNIKPGTKGFIKIEIELKKESEEFEEEVDIFSASLTRLGRDSNDAADGP